MQNYIVEKYESPSGKCVTGREKRKNNKSIDG